MTFQNYITRCCNTINASMFVLQSVSPENWVPFFYYLRLNGIGDIYRPQTKLGGKVIFS